MFRGAAPRRETATAPTEGLTALWIGAALTAAGAAGVGCGRVGFPPVDSSRTDAVGDLDAHVADDAAAPLDAPSRADALDASSTMDARVADASTLDAAPSIDARADDVPVDDVGTDTPSLDAAAPEAGPDPASICRIRWAVTFSGPGNDIVYEPWVPPSGGVRWNGLNGGGSGTMGGLACSSSCFGGFSREGAVGFVTGISGFVTGGPVRAVAVIGSGSTYSITEHDSVTGRAGAPLGAVTVAMPVSTGRAYATANGLSFHGSGGGSVDGLGSVTPAAGWGGSGNSGTRGAGCGACRN